MRCTANGASLYSDAKSSATLSTVSFGIGAAALITGAVLYFTSPTDSKTEKPAQNASIPHSVNVGFGFGNGSSYAVVSGGF
jgi:hypothetical protein